MTQHLSELRRRSLVCLVAIVLGTAALLPFTPALFAWLARPLTAALAGGPLVALAPFEAWGVYFKLALLGGVVLAAPVIASQFFAFAAPALNPSARRAVTLGGIAAGLLFIAGAAFCYAFVLPAGFSWAASMTQEMGAELLPSLDRSLSVALGLIAAFGIAFELPFAVAVAIALGLAGPASFRRARPYAVVGAFVVGAILTPPDVLSQTALAVPLIVLYELGIAVGALLVRRRRVTCAGNVS